MSIIFFLTEGMLRHMKINVSFGPSSGTDMSNFRPWLMDYGHLFKISCVLEKMLMNSTIGIIYVLIPGDNFDHRLTTSS